jgi:hypothetical protein
MPEDRKPDDSSDRQERGSIEVGRPYARMRVIVATVVFIIAIGVIVLRRLSGS